MTTGPTARPWPAGDGLTALVNKVPEVTVYFWLTKVLSTTVGHTFAGYLDNDLGLGLSVTTVVVGVGCLLALGLQLRARRYVPWTYWTTLALVGVLAALLSDDVRDRAGVPTVVGTPILAALLALTFAMWWRAERTLSIHTIRTPRREAFYWLAILLAFALGTTGGHALTEHLGVGHLAAAGIFAAAVAVVLLARWALGAERDALGFWPVFVLSGPLGASVGDYMSQPASDHGLALGTTATSVIFLGAILALVVFVSVTHIDVTDDSAYDAESVAAEAEAVAHHH